MPPFTYLPLDPAGQEIRLIRLLPSQFDDDIHVEIFHESLSEENVPEYEALSYAWGSTQTSHSIFISQTREPLANNQRPPGSIPSLGALKTLAITQNLSVALRHLRHSDTCRILWIDAICINQQNIPERSAEVGRMGLIYSKAARTTVWLGPESMNSTLATETLRSLGKGISYDPINHSFTVVPGSTIDNIKMDPDAIAAMAPEWEAIQNLLYRDWFTRLWVYQEIRLSRQHAIVVVGFSELTWSTFESVVWWVVATLPGIPTLETVLDMDYIDMHVRNVLRLSSTSMSVFQCIETTKHSLCSDPKDRLYGISNLHATTRYKICPDYSKTKEEVYEEFARSSIAKTKILDVLTLCELRSSSPTLPSWVPDLSVLKHTEIVPKRPHRSQNRAHFSALGKALHIEGITVDTIICLGTPLPSTAKPSETLAICRTWKYLVMLSGPYINGGTMIDAYIKTLIYGALKEDSPDSGDIPTLEEWRSAFSTFFQNSQINSVNMSYIRLIQRTLRGRTFGTTSRGDIGAFPCLAQIGDQICFILGSDGPLLLRPIPGRPGYFRLVGECYVAGLMNNEAFLGLLPKRWRFGEFDQHGNRIYVYDEKRSTLRDPRLGPLPGGWRTSYVGGQEVDEHGNLNQFWFTHEDSGEETYFDPRLSKGPLIERGVDMKEFILI
jgi:hypothetical protein